MEIQIQMKTLRGDLTPLTIKKTSNIDQLREEIASKLNVYEDFFKIVFQGNIIKTGLIEEHFKDGDFFIIVPTIPKYPVLPKLKATPQPSPPKSQTIPQKIFQGSPSRESSFFFGERSSPKNHFAIPVPEKAKVPKVPEINPQAVEMLTSMGFSENGSKRALYISKMNEQMAMEWLIEHCEDKELNDDIDQEWVNNLYGVTKPVAIPVPTPQQPFQAVPQDIHLDNILLDNSSPPEVDFVPDPIAMQNFATMGFPEEDIKQALKVHKNNPELAAAWLLGEREFDDDDDDDDSFQLDENNPFIQTLMNNPQIQESLQNPRVMEAIKHLMENPSAISQYLNDPELGPTLNIVCNSLFGKTQ